MDDDLACQHQRDWEHKSIWLHWNKLAHVWEVSGKPIQDVRAALASERAQGWNLYAAMRDEWVATKTPGRTYLVCFERRIH